MVSGGQTQNYCIQLLTNSLNLRVFPDVVIHLPSYISNTNIQGVGWICTSEVTAANAMYCHNIISTSPIPPALKLSFVVPPKSEFDVCVDVVSKETIDSACISSLRK